MLVRTPVVLQFMRNICHLRMNVHQDFWVASLVVSPLKSITIPRLKLCGAVLLVRLMKSISETIQQPIDKVYYFTDSSKVLAWIKKKSHQLKTFVANKVSFIRRMTAVNKWYDVSTHNKLTDLISRGAGPKDFLHNDLMVVWTNIPD
ncbi:uncharacterized protein LOC118200255 [Stegodyphus dumicola]|uniref:uncharacterized protein LOC118200255 n=1 Tax=Stegodyphus dumicola TaxID=202533 RepID=UPI0015B183CA|nr:uncharacterized protein LOC118200255 [Stegodyphus dumicola]